MTRCLMIIPAFGVHLQDSIEITLPETVFLQGLGGNPCFGGESRDIPDFVIFAPKPPSLKYTFCMAWEQILVTWCRMVNFAISVNL